MRIDAIAVAKRLMKMAVKNKRSSLAGTWIGRDGRQYVTDGYCMIMRFDEPQDKLADCAEIQGLDRADEYFDEDFHTELYTYDPDTFKEKMAEAKAKWKQMYPRKSHRVIYRFGNGQGANAEFMLLAMRATGDHRPKTFERKNSRGYSSAPFLFTGKGCEFFLFPVVVDSDSSEGFVCT